MKSDRIRSRSRDQRGALLIVAMLLAAIVGIALTSFIRVGQTTLELSNRSFYNNGAINLCETGLEQAMWSINRMVAGRTDAWDGWTNDGVNAWRSFDGGSFGQNTTGSVRVYVFNYLGLAAPQVVSRGIVTPPNGAPVEKWVFVQLRKRSKFANGLVARNQILFNGNNATVDSWNSDPDNNPATAAVPYSSSVRNDNGTVGSISVSVSAVLVNNADIWGYAATGGSQPQVGSNGTILGDDSAAGGFSKVDPRRISTDFSANFDPVTSPTSGTTIASVGTTLGTTGTSTTWRLGSLSMSGSDQLTINGNVTLIMTAPAGTTAISVTGNAGINIPAGSSLTIYAEGDVKIAGNGLLNSNTQPVSFQLWGTRPTPSQDIEIAGNGALKAIVYAPAADVDVNGNGDVMGSVVANNITLVGNANFHYDESLANFNAGSPYGITRWRELTTATERGWYASALNF